MLKSSQSAAPVLISASRRTDIPRFFADWFVARRAAGYVEFENVFRARGRVSLVASDVLGYLFWTRDATPLMTELSRLRSAGIAYAFQFTITAYGPELEPNRPTLERAIGNFQAISSELPGPASIQWRYDPIIDSDRYPPAFHRDTLGRIAEQLAGYTRVVNISLVEPYWKALRRINDPSVRYRGPDPARHAASRRRTKLRFAGEQAALLTADLVQLGRAYGMELRACADPEFGLRPSQCCSLELFEPYGADCLARLRSLRPAPSRSGCRCLRAVDIGMSETCRGGCRYCYVVSSDRSVSEHAAEYDVHAASLRRVRS